jgi:hypothetical protein
VSGESLLPALERVAQALAHARGFEGRACRFEPICDSEGRVVAVWSHAEPPKLTRHELELIELPRP